MKKKPLTQVPLEISVYLRYLYQDKGMKGKELLKMYPKLLKAAIYRRTKKFVADKTVDNRKYNHSRLRKISPWDKCLILRAKLPILQEQYGSFITIDLNNWELALELGKMCQMKQWDMYYVVLAIDFTFQKKRFIEKGRY